MAMGTRKQREKQVGIRYPEFAHLYGKLPNFFIS
jgi:hypothetical protein